MCHLILFLPVLALPIFWIVPPALAVPAYAVVLVLSAGMYWLAIRALHRPVTCGPEALLGRQGAVMQTGRNPKVRIGTEIWRVESEEPLSVGQIIRVVARDGLVLIVRSESADKASAGV